MRIPSMLRRRVAFAALVLCGLPLADVRAVTPVGTAESPVEPARRRLPHLKLKRAFPAPDSTVSTAPESIRLWFSEDADLIATRITVAAANGVTIGMRKPVRAPGRDMPITAAFTAPLAPGRYTVTWKTMSKDGHVVNGAYDFVFAAR
jgi:methionine-rich copper-binding protein CopC